MTTFARVLQHKLAVAKKLRVDQTHRFEHGLEVRFVADPESMILTRDREGKEAGETEAHTCAKHAGWGGAYTVDPIERVSHPRALLVKKGRALL